MFDLVLTPEELHRPRRRRTEPPAVAGGAAARLRLRFSRLNRMVSPELAIRSSPAHGLPAAVLFFVCTQIYFPNVYPMFKL